MSVTGDEAQRMAKELVALIRRSRARQESA
jgi:hypothetical protein